jgi:hypothetical protein
LILLLAGAAVDFAGDFVGEVEVVVDYLFEVDTGGVGILQEGLKRGFARCDSPSCSRGPAA